MFRVVQELREKMYHKVGALEPVHEMIPRFASVYINDTGRPGNRKNNNDPHNIGRLVVLPSSQIGSHRYMRQKMHDIIDISS